MLGILVFESFRAVRLADARSDLPLQLCWLATEGTQESDRAAATAQQAIFRAGVSSDIAQG